MRASACAALASLCLLPSAVGDGLRVALHGARSRSTTPPLHGWVAGSVDHDRHRRVVGDGQREAAARIPSKQRGGCEDTAYRRVPSASWFSYGGLFDRAWDVALVEEYIGDVPSFVRVVRAVSPSFASSSTGVSTRTRRA